MYFVDFGDFGGVSLPCLRAADGEGLLIFGGSVGDNGGGIMLEVFCGLVGLVFEIVDAGFGLDTGLVV